MLAGWYHATSFTANAAQVTPEDGVPRFADVAAQPAEPGSGSGLHTAGRVFGDMRQKLCR